MTEYVQGAPLTQTPAEFSVDSHAPSSPDQAYRIPPLAYLHAADAGDASPGTLVQNNSHKLTAASRTFPAQEVPNASFAVDWFETWHVVPRSFDFGNLLSDQSVPLQVFNSHRRLPERQWTSFVSNAGAGVELGGEPSLPTLVGPLTSIQMTLDVSTDGDPLVDATLDFEFLGVGTAFVPILIQRIVLWGAEPEVQFDEMLEFRTDVKTALDGKEKRAKLRAVPRQTWIYDYVINEGTEAQILENLLFDFQTSNFGVPIWFEESRVTATVASGATTITVNSTGFRDYVDDLFAVIFTSQGTFDVLQIDTGGVTATTLTFTSPTVNAYVVGTRVFPLSISRTRGDLSGSRFPVGLRTISHQFTAMESITDRSDLTPYSSYKSKLLLDVGNSIVGTVPHQFSQQITRQDGQVGNVEHTSQWDRNKRGHNFTMRAEGLQAIFEMRGLIHAIGGRWQSFYVPTDSDDLNITANLLSGGNGMTITNVDYARFVRQRQSKSDLRVNFVDGSTPLLRAITSSSTIDPATELLNVDVNWPTTITPAEVSRIEYLEKLRFASDTIRITYDRNGTIARMSANLVGVFE